MYVVRIAASGQEVKGWSDGVLDNIKGEVSSIYTYIVHSCAPSTPTASPGVLHNDARLLTREKKMKT